MCFFFGGVEGGVVLTSFVIVLLLLLYASSAIFLAIMAAFCFLATITLNRSKSDKLARFFLAFNFFAHDVASHLAIVSASVQACFKVFCLALGWILTVKSVKAIRL